MAGLAILVGLVVYLVTLSDCCARGPAGRRRRSAPHAIRSIAVLPLDNYSGDPSQDYFAEGMTDELTSDLATISQLRVISRGSAMQFKGKNRPPTPEIAKTLNVDAIVEGSVLRAGDKVRITAQLIDARADRHLWAQELRAQLARRAGAAGRAGVGDRPRDPRSADSGRAVTADQRPSVNPAAYDAYLKGRYFFNRPSDENLKKAIELFEEAVKLDPNYAPAFSGLSDAYLWAGYNEGVLTGAEARPKAKAAAEKAIELDDNSAEGHTSLANFKLWYEYDWAGAEAEFRRAFALNPNYAFAHDQFGLGLAFQGRFDEVDRRGQARGRARPAFPADPHSTRASRSAWKGEYQAAKEQVKRAADLDPTLLLRSTGRRVDRHSGGKGPRRDPGIPQGQGDGIAGVRVRLARVRVRGFGRPGGRAGGARGPEEEVAARSVHAVQPGARVLSAWAIAHARWTTWKRRTPPTRSGWGGSRTTGSSILSARSRASSRC